MSSFFDSASLVQIPSGYSDGTLYSVKPIDGSGDLTFSRGSDIEATRVAANGYIEKAKVNLLLQSNSFNTSWSISDGTLTSGQSGYDGSSNAWQLTTTTTAGSVFQANTISGVQTFSIYAKSDGSTGIRMYAFGSVNQSAFFNLIAGTVTSTNSIEAKIEAVSGATGWYRCSIAFNQTNTQVRCYTANAAGTTNSAGTIYIQDAQLNYGLVAQEYQETTTTSVITGITNDMPRLNYDPANPTCPSLLLEPAATNMVAHDSYFNASDWNKVACTITNNYAVSPEGVQNASLFSVSGSTNSLTDFVTSSTGVTYTISIYAKNVDAGNLRIDMANVAAGPAFDFATETFSTATGWTSGFERLQDGWYRLWAARNSVSTGASPQYHINGSSGSVLIYGAQYEARTYPTSLIPTYGTSATRTVDVCSKTGISSLIGQTEGTLFVDLTIDNLAGQTNNPIPFSLKGSGSTSTYIALYATGRLQAVHYGFGSVQCNINLNSYGLTDGRHKFAFVYSENNFKLFVDGALAGSDTSGLVDAQSEAYLGYYNTSNNGSINNHQALLFPTALTDAECIALTA
jgi:hypothetical protein